VRIVILDACRDNAVEQNLKREAARGAAVTRGLAPMGNPTGLIIAYATQHLATAADDVSSNKPGRRPVLMGRIVRSAEPVHGSAPRQHRHAGRRCHRFRKVGRKVDAATGGKQRPEISNSMYEQYALAPAPSAGGSTSLPSDPQPDETTWSILKDAKDAELIRLSELDSFMRHHCATDQTPSCSGQSGPSHRRRRMPWPSGLERARGRHVSGVAQKTGGIKWSFARKRGLVIKAAGRLDRSP
jgi:hypothetical protein